MLSSKEAPGMPAVHYVEVYLILKVRYLNEEQVSQAVFRPVIVDFVLLTGVLAGQF